MITKTAVGMLKMVWYGRKTGAEIDRHLFGRRLHHLDSSLNTPNRKRTHVPQRSVGGALGKSLGCLKVQAQLVVDVLEAGARQSEALGRHTLLTIAQRGISNALSV